MCEQSINRTNLKVFCRRRKPHDQDINIMMASISDIWDMILFGSDLTAEIQASAAMRFHY